MSGFVHPPWSGFSGAAASAISGTGDASKRAGHEVERLVLGRAAAQIQDLAPAELPPEAGQASAPPPSVTPASPRPDKALIPGFWTP